MKYDFETAEPISEKSPPKESTEKEHENMRRLWKLSPWFIATTDQQGQVEIAVKCGRIDRTTGTKPPSWRDEVTDKPFLIKVRQGQTRGEELTVWMKPGESVKGKLFTVTVLDIQEPQYVKTSDDRSRNDF
jgi:hypothetical protein